MTLQEAQPITALLDPETVQSIADKRGRGDTVIVRVPFSKAGK